jgi:predicted ABC-type ATPase
MKSPRLIVVAGANGAGKTTLTHRLARRFGAHFGLLLDTDALAKALAPDDPRRAAIQAARASLTTLNRVLASRERVVVETTLSDHHRHLELIQQAKSQGYAVWLYYVGLENASIHLARVQQRVALGGHDVPATDVLRRFECSRANLLETIRAVDRTMMYHNSGRTLRLVASMERGTLRRFSSDTGWWTPLLQQLETV